MNNIYDIKGNLKNSNALDIICESMYMPTEEKLNRVVESYLNNKDIVVYGYCLNDKIFALIVLDVNNKENITILNIAVNKSIKGKGIGSSLIDYSIRKLNPKTLTAETDDDAVDFYRKYGFLIKNLGEKYEGINRYECKYLCR